MKHKLKICLACVLGWLCLETFNNPAYAEGTIRSARKDDYTRLVIDWTSAVPYTVQVSGSSGETKTVTVTFKTDRPLTEPVSEDIRNPNLKSLELSGDTEQPSLEAVVPSGSEIRHFQIGDRVIIDLYDPPAGPVTFSVQNNLPPASRIERAEPGKPQTNPESQIQAASSDQPDQINMESEDTRGQETVSPINVQALEETGFSEPVSPDGYSITEPHVIRISATQSLGLAAYKRFGNLWIVHNQPDNNIPPEILGPEKEKFPEFERYSLDDAALFKLQLPSNSHEIYSEGGTLLWRLIITPDEPPARQDVAPERRFGNTEESQAALFWPLRSIRDLVTYTDPVTGETVYAAVVTDSADFAGRKRDFVELEQFNSVAGVTISSKIDNLGVRSTGTGLVVSKEGGLALTKQRDLKTRILETDEEIEVDEQSSNEDVNENSQELRRIFNFERWLMGGPNDIINNEFILLSGLRDRDKTGQIEDILTLAKLNLSNHRAIETLGFLDYARQELSNLDQNAEYIALKGAANTLAGRYSEAVNNLFYSGLDDYYEIRYWRAMALAGAGDWQQAAEVLPKTISLIRNYPYTLRHKVALPLAEVALRDGNVELAEEYLSIPKSMNSQLSQFDKAELDYLSGESHRQRGEIDRTIFLWEPLAKSLDKKYRVKAGFALTRLLYDEGTITLDEAIERLQTYRFSWREDILETRMNYQLGMLYIETNDYLKGLSILKRATLLTPEAPIAEEITGVMAESFRDIFLTDKLDKLPPLEAIAVYQEFQELTPPDKTGDAVISNLAERLVEVELLGQASDLFNYLINSRLEGKEAAQTAARLAAIYLIDALPDEALEALKKAKTILARNELRHLELEEDIELLEARALADTGNVQEALSRLSRLPQNEDVLRLRADIAWQEGQWITAARSLEQLIAKQRISIQTNLTAEQASMILNWAVALNLAGEDRALASLRNRFSRAMQETKRSKLFEVVTRPQKSSRLSDRNTINALVTEVDLFRNFLETYRETKRLQDVSN